MDGWLTSDNRLARSYWLMGVCLLICNRVEEAWHTYWLSWSRGPSEKRQKHFERVLKEVCSAI
jgi:hypothetical protein